MTAPPKLQRRAMIERTAHTLAARGESSVALWQKLVPALGKIIGDAGFESLFFRSVYQAEAIHPWLAADQDARSLDHLTACMATRDPAEAEAASIDLLIIFIDTLNLLIGELVTHRILLAAWGTLAVEDAPESSQ